MKYKSILAAVPFFWRRGLHETENEDEGGKKAKDVLLSLLVVQAHHFIQGSVSALW